MGLTLETKDDGFVHHPSTHWPGVEVSDRRWFERFWLNVHDLKSGTTLGHGMAVYPNLGISDGFACFVEGDRQLNVRVSQHQEGGDHLTVGPFRAEVNTPLRSWRFSLKPGQAPLSFDLEFEGGFSPVLHELPFGPAASELPIRWNTFAQTGRLRGEITVGDRRIEVTPDSWRAGRDRSWGVRPGIGGPGEIEWVDAFSRLGWGFLLYWVLFQTSDRQVWYFGTHEPGGGNRHFTGCIVSSSGQVTPIADVEHDVTLKSDSGRFQHASIRIHSSDATPMEFIVHPRATVYLRGGGYDGIGGHHHGSDRGKTHSESETWEMTQNGTRELATGLNDHVCHFEGRDVHGDGIFEIHYGT